MSIQIASTIVVAAMIPPAIKEVKKYLHEKEMERRAERSLLEERTLRIYIAVSESRSKVDNANLGIKNPGFFQSKQMTEKKCSELHKALFDSHLHFKEIKEASLLVDKMESEIGKKGWQSEKEQYDTQRLVQHSQARLKNTQEALNNIIESGKITLRASNCANKDF